MADYGTTTAEYMPDVNTYSGLIGKIAVQLVKGEGIKNEYAGLYKEPMRTGKDLEVAVYKKATGVDYSATDAPAAPFPGKEVLLFKSNVKRTYGVTIDQKEIDEGATNTANASKIASEIVRTLYTGAYDEDNANVYSIFHEADAEEDEIIDAGTYEEPTNAETAKTLLAKIKNFAKYIRRGRAKVNPKGLSVRADTVCLLIPTEALTAIDVWAKLDGQNLDFARFGVDEVYEYDVEEGETAEIYVFDSEYAQIRSVHADSYKEQQVAGCDNVKAYLHRYVQYAGCPLFGCVRLTETSAAPAGITYQHVVIDGVTTAASDYATGDPTIFQADGKQYAAPVMMGALEEETLVPVVAIGGGSTYETSTARPVTVAVTSSEEPLDVSVQNWNAGTLPVEVQE